MQLLPNLASFRGKSGVGLLGSNLRETTAVHRSAVGRLVWPEHIRNLTIALLVGLAATCSSDVLADAPLVEFETEPGKVAISIAGHPFANYVYYDAEISRPYFSHVCAPGGVQVTRNHPPIDGQDVADHPTYHPGIWMAFGDISGSDFWRLKTPVKHVSFVEDPHGGPGEGSFAVRNRYVDQLDADRVVCEELCRFTVLIRPAGYLLTWDTTFQAADEFYFGDQEEMGLGIRVASPIRVEKQHKKRPAATIGNGTILDAEGRRNGDEVWGNASDWCDYSGTLDGQHVGATIFCHPDNFRPTWFHARDYGLMLANPFGREAFGKGPTSKVVVKPGESFRLRYAVLLHAGPTDSKPNLNAAYADYLKVSK